MINNDKVKNYKGIHKDRHKIIIHKKYDMNIKFFMRLSWKTFFIIFFFGTTALFRRPKHDRQTIRLMTFDYR